MGRELLKANGNHGIRKLKIGMKIWSNRFDGRFETFNWRKQKQIPNESASNAWKCLKNMNSFTSKRYYTWSKDHWKKYIHINMFKLRKECSKVNFNKAKILSVDRQTPFSAKIDEEPAIAGRPGGPVCRGLLPRRPARLGDAAVKPVIWLVLEARCWRGSRALC